MTNNYLKSILTAILLGLSSVLLSQNVAINTTGAAGNSAAILDMSANTSTGLLIPNVSITNINSPTCIITVPALTAATAPDGLMVYNTNAATVGGNGIGYYYWSHTNLQWQYMQNGTNTLVCVKTFSAAGAYTYTPSSGVNAILVKMVGGGGGGGGAKGTAAPGGNGGGGGAGAYAEVFLSGIAADVAAGGTFTGSVAASVLGGTIAPTAGTNGNPTTFINSVSGITYTAAGGSGGAANTNSTLALGGAGGTAAATGAGVFAMNITGGAGGNGVGTTVTGTVSFTGITILGITVLGTDVITMYGVGNSGTGGISALGGAGASVGGGTATTGINASANSGSGGSGGSASYEGSNVSAAGGDGAAGLVVIYEYR